MKVLVTGTAGFIGCEVALPDTENDTSELIRAAGYAPRMRIEEGLGRFARWFRERSDQ